MYASHALGAFNQFAAAKSAAEALTNGAEMFKNLFSGAPNSTDVPLEAFALAVRGGEVTVVDVREPHEYAAGHIPGSVNLPLSRFDPRALPDGKPVVLICQAGGRSATPSAKRTPPVAARSNTTRAACPNGVRMAAM